MLKGVVIFLILFATKTAAADLSKCVALENDIERLSCYDEAVGRSVEKQTKIEGTFSSKVDSNDPIICRGIKLICFSPVAINTTRTVSRTVMGIIKNPVFNNGNMFRTRY